MHYSEDDYIKIIMFISDRSKGLANAIVKVFPSHIITIYAIFKQISSKQIAS